MSIPRRIIQTARDRTLSPTAKASAANLRLLHPQWEYVFFDDDDIKRFVANEFPQFKRIFESFPRPIQRIDFFRYLAVFRLGGFYFDLDVFLSRELTELLGNTCVFPFEELTLSRYLRNRYGLDWEIGNYGFGASAGSDFLLAVIENCRRAQEDPIWIRPMLEGVPSIFHSDFNVLNTTGPGLLTRTMAENPNLSDNITVLFPEDVCEPSTWHLFGQYGVHMMEGSWRSKGGYVRRRVADWWENKSRKQLLPESERLGPKRTQRGITVRPSSGHR